MSTATAPAPRPSVHAVGAALTPHATLTAPPHTAHASTVTPSSAPSAAPVTGHSVPDLLLALLLSGAVVAAIVNIVLTRRKSLEDERARIRTTCAEAFETVAAYKESPYAIRRRRHDSPGEERARLSDELRRVQARLSYFTAWMRWEGATLAAAFDDLVSNLRRVAGKACHDAWLAAAADSDHAMNIPPNVVNLSELAQFEDAYITAVKTYLDQIIKTRRILKFPRR
ncbi:MAG: hypothetical protein JWN95_480 [Frankiales bacterium]|nr:hypothetical protein [Frankiales bacterium]